MATKDEDILKLGGSTPPPDDGDGEGEVTRVGSQAEIQKALLEENLQGFAGKAVPNNLPTPPAPPPSEEMRKLSRESVGKMKLAPPPADLAAAAGRGDEKDTAPPPAEPSAQELDSSLLEPAPPTGRGVAPPLPLAARRASTPSAADERAPAFPAPEPTSMAPPTSAPPAAPRAELVAPSGAPEAYKPRSVLVVVAVVAMLLAVVFGAALLSSR